MVFCNLKHSNINQQVMPSYTITVNNKSKTVNVDAGDGDFRSPLPSSSSGSSTKEESPSQPPFLSQPSHDDDDHEADRVGAIVSGQTILDENDDVLIVATLWSDDTCCCST